MISSVHVLNEDGTVKHEGAGSMKILEFDQDCEMEVRVEVRLLGFCKVADVIVSLPSSSLALVPSFLMHTV